jgi:molecular chaperone GrpE
MISGVTPAALTGLDRRPAAPDRPARRSIIAESIMANTPPDDSDPNAARPGETPGGPGGAPAPGDAARAAGESAERTVHDIIAALQAEVADFRDKWLRAHAEIDNVRKRAEREKEETAKYAISKLARDIVNVGDNFQRAIEAVPVGAAELDPALKSFLDGVTLTERELFNVLDRHGIKRIHPLNEPFNPHLHQAVMELQRTDVPAGTAVQVFQAGYTIEDRVLRPAMVAVSKGGPKTTPASEATPPGAGPTAPPGEGIP